MDVGVTHFQLLMSVARDNPYNVNCPRTSSFFVDQKIVSKQLVCACFPVLLIQDPPFSLSASNRLITSEAKQLRPNQSSAILYKLSREHPAA